jgi:hypothetical protein
MKDLLGTKTKQNKTKQVHDFRLIFLILLVFYIRELSHSCCQRSEWCASVCGVPRKKILVSCRALQFFYEKGRNFSTEGFEF